MKEIVSKNNDYIKGLNKLKTKKEIIKNGKFLVEGKNVIHEAYLAGIIEEILFTENQEPEYSDIRKVKVSQDVIDKLSENKTNPGLIAVCKYEEKHIDLENMNKIIILDSVNNPGNLGTIIRSAKAFGFDAIITTGESVFPYNEKVIRSTQGALFNYPIAYFDDVTKLKKFEPFHFTLDSNATSLDKIKPSGKFALVFGNEANGISKEVMNKLPGKSVYIKIKDVESLNLASAASIAMNKFK